MIGTPNFRFENNLENLFNRDVSPPIGDRIYEHLSNTLHGYFDDTLEEARGVRNAIKEEPLFSNRKVRPPYIPNIIT